MSSKISILHWNDVYKVGPQKLDPKSPDTIDVTQFAQLLIDLRSRWTSDPSRAELTLFSGDIFSPSTESSVTRGSHMVPVINLLAPDVSLTGNHDFDFGYPHLTKLVRDTNFPWVLSNIVDSQTSKCPTGLHEYCVVEKAGLRIGIIGLVEKEWIATVSSWPPTFKWRDMTETGLDLSKRLRDPNGENVDLIIALTHSRIPNDVTLAKSLFALSASAQEQAPINNQHGVDLILGGHDHLYYAPRGVQSWEGYDITQPCLGAEEDEGDILVVKSGMDFRDLSEINLELRACAPGSVRKNVIKSITGVHHTTKPDSKSCEALRAILDDVLQSVSGALKAPVCRTSVPLDLRSRLIRTDESAAGNWFADVLRHAYDDALCLKSGGGSDGVFICAGTLRGDSQYGPGEITLGDIMEILPFEDPIVVIELDGAAIWDALEAALAPWPAQEGRFPVISGFRVSWDSTREPGNRVSGVWLIEEADGSEDLAELENDNTQWLDIEPIKREKGGKLYKMVTREYLAEGHDGFDAFKGSRYLIDDEGGALMSSLVRQYLMGSHFVNRLSRLLSHPSSENLQETTKECIKRRTSAVARWKNAASKVLSHRRRADYQDHSRVSRIEDMNGIDCLNGEQMRKGLPKPQRRESMFDTEDLLVIAPIVDGRLKDEGRA